MLSLNTAQPYLERIGWKPHSKQAIWPGEAKTKATKEKKKIENKTKNNNKGSNNVDKALFNHCSGVDITLDWYRSGGRRTRERSRAGEGCVYVCVWRVGGGGGGGSQACSLYYLIFLFIYLFVQTRGISIRMINLFKFDVFQQRCFGI